MKPELPSQTAGGSILSYALKHPEYFANSVRRLLSPGNYRAMFYFLLLRQGHFAQAGIAPWGSYYEFGVGWGGTLVAFLHALSDCRKTLGRMGDLYRVVGFDSFEGLPKQSSPRDESAEWRPALFAHSLEEIRQTIASARLDLRAVDLRFVRGFFDTSLTDGLRNELREFPPSIVTVDVDYYSSTKVVLEWLRPVLRSGTLFYFDDIWSFHGNPQYGQLAAIREFNSLGDGQLVNLPAEVPVNLLSHVYVFSRKEFEYR